MSLINSTAIPSGASAYEIEQSLKFPDGNNNLHRTPSSAGNRKTWTFSAWVKIAEDRSNTAYIFNRAWNGTNFGLYLVGSSNAIEWSDYSSSTYQYKLVTNASYRDPSAWSHVMVVLDTTQGTSSNRAKMYINGSQITSLATATYPSQQFEGQCNTALQHNIGADTSGNALGGYMAEVNFIDGIAKAPTDFGEYGTYGEWKPKEYSGSYGTNGFYLNFAGGGIISSATGGNSTGTTGDYKYKTYTSNGTFTPSNDGYVEYLVVGGGGGGGSRLGGGGGGGGFRTGFVQLTGSTAYTVTVGAGGAYDASGNNSSVSGTGITTLTASGGGTGGAGNHVSAGGGSGGGGAGITTGNTNGSAGTSGQGNDGGDGAGSAGFAGGGGGGAGADGADGVQSGKGGNGGAGLQSNIDTNNYYYSGGGGGGAHFAPSTGAGNGGIGGGGGGARGGGSTDGGIHGNGTGGGSARNSGGSPADAVNQLGGNGGANTGGGGGGAPNNVNSGGAGGSGIVIIRYKFQ